MNILIIDSCPILRKGLLEMLHSEGLVEDIFEASSMKEALLLFSNKRIDAVIFEIDIIGVDGLEFIKESKLKNPQNIFIVFTSSVNKNYLVRSQKANVDGFILKDAKVEDVIYGIKQIFCGRKFFDYHYEDNNNDFPKMDISTLSSREKEILFELSKGLSNALIASKLFISENTVKTHVSNILSKLNLRNRTEAALVIKYIDEDS